MADFTNTVAVTATPAILPYPGDITVVPGEGNGVAYVNRVFDSVAGEDVSWSTLGAPDLTSGVSYPGPGTFNVDTSQGTIEAIIPASTVT